MLNFEIDPALLVDDVPGGTELDFHDGRTFVSVVGFQFLNTRVRGVPIPGHRHFEEVNLRFYVRRRGPDGWRRGVVFIKELVPRWAIAFVARVIYGENYCSLPMRHSVALPRLSYEWKSAGAWQRIAVEVGGDPVCPPSGSEESFIAEHYWGYSKTRRGHTIEYEVEHPPWLVWSNAVPESVGEVANFYGERFVEPLSAPPSSTFAAEGSLVSVYPGQRIL